MARTTHNLDVQMRAVDQLSPTLQKIVDRLDDLIDATDETNDKLGNLSTESRKAAKNVKAVGENSKTTSRNVSSLASKLNSARLAAAGAAAAIAVAGAKFLSFNIKQIDMIDSLAKSSQKLGVSVEALQKYRFAAASSGASVEHLETGLRALQRRYILSIGKTNEFSKAFEALGVDVSKSADATKPVGQLLNEVADGLQNTETHSVKVTTAIATMGDSAMNLLPMLSGGSKGLKEFGDQSALTGIITEKQAKIAEELRQRLDNLNQMWSAFAAVLIERSAPAMRSLINVTMGLMGAIKKGLSTLDSLKSRFDFLNVTVDRAVAFIKRFNVVMGKGLEITVEWIKSLADEGENVNNALGSIKRSTDDVSDAFDEGRSKANSYTQETKSLKDAMRALLGTQNEVAAIDFTNSSLPGYAADLNEILGLHNQIDFAAEDNIRALNGAGEAIGRLVEAHKTEAQAIIDGAKAAAAAVKAEVDLLERKARLVQSIQEAQEEANKKALREMQRQQAEAQQFIGSIVNGIAQIVQSDKTAEESSKRAALAKKKASLLIKEGKKAEALQELENARIAEHTARQQRRHADLAKAQMIARIIAIITAKAAEAAASSYASAQSLPFPANIAAGISAAATATAFVLGLVGKVQGLSTGGVVEGGERGRDSVLAMLQPGELVVPTKMVAQMRKILNEPPSTPSMDHSIQRFGKGGVVGTETGKSATGGTTVNITNNILQPDKVMAARLVDQQQRAIKKLKRGTLLRR